MPFKAIDNLPPIHPGELLKDELDALGMSARKFAAHIGVPANAVTSILNGRRAISAAMAQRLGKAFATGPRYWMMLQSNFDEKLSRTALAAAIKAIKPLSRQAAE